MDSYNWRLITVICILLLLFIKLGSGQITTPSLEDSFSTRARNCRLSLRRGTTDGCTQTAVPNRWFYNIARGICEKFNFTGCSGNKNNFPAEDYCLTYCFAHLPASAKECGFGGTPFVNPITGDLLKCGENDAISCPSTHQCTPYQTFDKRRASFYCCPKQQTVCTRFPESGSLCGTVNVTRWSYNYMNGECYLFWYNGCDACPRGDMPMADTVNGGMVQCRGTEFSNDCPPGYNCYKNVYRSGYICCAGRQETCEAPYMAYLHPVLNETMECQPSIRSTCPWGSSCRQSSSDGKYYCCKTGECLPGVRSYVDPSFGVAKKCNSNDPCPLGFTCHTSGVCCTGTSTLSIITTTALTIGITVDNNAICPTNQIVYRNTNGVSPQCTLDGSAPCPSGFFCQYSATKAQFYCCKIDAGCPGGQSAEINPSTGQLINCTVTSCSFGNECFTSTKVGKVCCPVSSSPTTPGSAVVSQSECPSGMTPYVFPGTTTPQTCAPTAQSCTSTYTCERSAAGIYYCCKTNKPNVCPSSSNPYFFPGTTIEQTCAPNVNGICPSGYTCAHGTDNRYYCCTIIIVTSTPAAITPAPQIVVTPQVIQPIPNQTPTATDMCPVGAAVFQSNQVCAPGVTQCPTGFRCRQLGAGGHYFCCSDSISSATTQRTPAPPNLTVIQPIRQTLPSTNICAGNRTPYFYAGTNNPQPCNPSLATCAADYSCSVGPSGLAFCCRSTGQESGNLVLLSTTTTENLLYYCPSPQSLPQTDASGRYADCDIGNPNCAFGYSCQPAPRGGYYCCSSGVGLDECPAGSNLRPVLDNGLLTYCEPTNAANKCPVWQCMYSFKRQSYICCGGSNGQPQGTRAPAIVTTRAATVEIRPPPDLTPGIPARQRVTTVASSVEGPLTRETNDEYCPILLLKFTLQCSPGNNVCPMPFVCRYTEASGGYSCCILPYTDLEYCPAGGAPVVREKVPVLCSGGVLNPNSGPDNRINGFSYCPPSAICQTSRWNYYACCSQTRSPIQSIPSPVAVPITQAPKVTKAGSGPKAPDKESNIVIPPIIIKPVDSNQRITLPTRITQQTSDSTCPIKLISPASCNPDQPNSCGVPYVCKYSWSDDSWSCCSNQGIGPIMSKINYTPCCLGDKDCPGGGAPVIAGNVYVTCVPNGGTGDCFPPSTCQYSTFRRIYLCCTNGLLENYVLPVDNLRVTAATTRLQPLYTPQLPPVVQVPISSVATQPTTTLRKITTASTPAAYRVILPKQPAKLVTTMAPRDTLESSATGDKSCPRMMRTFNPYCTPGLSNSCPGGFACIYRAELGAYVCCLSRTLPTSESTLLPPPLESYENEISVSGTQSKAGIQSPTGCEIMTGNSIECPPEDSSLCPAFTKCSFSWSSNKWWCCPTSKVQVAFDIPRTNPPLTTASTTGLANPTDDCPPGDRPVLAQDGLNLAECFNKKCPSFSTCRYSKMRKTYVCCATVKTYLARPIPVRYATSNRGQKKNEHVSPTYYLDNEYDPKEYGRSGLEILKAKCPTGYTLFDGLCYLHGYSRYAIRKLNL